MLENKIFVRDVYGIDDSLSIFLTTRVIGIFVVLIFLSHFCQYIDVNKLMYFGPYLFLRRILGQLIVAPFLFYSGYGVMEQIKEKGEDYIDDMPKKRIFKTWIHFALAVLIYLIISLYLRREYSLSTMFLAFIGWESLGNSNWYIFAILVMYTCTYLSFKFFRNTKAVWFGFALSLTYIVVMYFAKKGSWWYDTILCFPTGIFVSYYKRNGDFFIIQRYWSIVIICLTAFAFRENLIVHELLSIFFCFAIILLCSHIKIKSRILLFLGRHAFEIYILQRIPMILLQEYIDGYAYMVTCLFVSIILAVLFKFLERKVDLILKI